MRNGLWVERRTPTAAASDEPRIVLVHGSMDRSGGFARVLRHLHDVPLVRYDRRGYGRSREHAQPADIDTHVTDLLEVIGDEPSLVVGHSMGGVIALAAAQRATDQVLGVLAYEAPMPWEPWWSAGMIGATALATAFDSGAEDAAEAFMRYTLGDALWERLDPQTRAARRAEGPTLVAELESVRRCVPYVPEAIEVPVLAAHGSLAQPRHRRGTAELATRVRRGELRVIDGAGHPAPMSHPVAFAQLCSHLARWVRHDSR